jgi:NAD-dependent SIR2 family protein deacetylase
MLMDFTKVSGSENKGFLFNYNLTQHFFFFFRFPEAGSKRVFELHGNSKRASCIKTDCKTPMSLDRIRELRKESQIPKCPKCDSLVKTDVILFGEKLPTSEMHGKNNNAHKHAFELITELQQ